MKTKSILSITRRRLTALFAALILTLIGGAWTVQAQTSAFTYQGRLTDSSAAANGVYDFQFRLLEASGFQLGVLTREDVQVRDGIFTVQLDFGAGAFSTADRFLEIGVRAGTSTGAFTILAPRQQVTSAPLAIQSLRSTFSGSAFSADNATNAANADKLDGIDSSGFVQTNSTAFIRNQTAQQPASNFNISGDGAAGGTLSGNTVNATTGYNFGGVRVLNVPNSTSVTLGLQAGSALGADNTNNTFVGNRAGVQCATTQNLGNCFDNTFLGRNAGGKSAVGEGNTFVGAEVNNAGISPSKSGTNNTLLGFGASLFNDDLSYATAIGAGAAVQENNTVVLGRSTGLDTVFAPGQIRANGRIQALGGISLNNNDLRLRTADDAFHRIRYNSSINGMQFDAFDDYLWYNHRNTRVNMRLESDGDLGIVGSYGQLSDARYKTNVQTFSGALDAVKRLRGVTFNWRPELGKSPDAQIGFIAQEVEAVLPALVSTGEDGYKSVSYANAVPVLVEAVKEQQTQIERQNAQIETQNARIEQQQNQINELKQIVCAITPGAAVCQKEK